MLSHKKKTFDANPIQAGAPVLGGLTADGGLNSCTYTGAGSSPTPSVVDDGESDRERRKLVSSCKRDETQGM
ncbi:hypothetical protein FNV43_RR26514 [Rhamnella rubrinervis]|uniref:Uncharacterized protein n=1 Tax=Rhamnella rubrinervis TaxID=2594499 RepID=A0A8K0DPF8_9ROSA|nr:hypothetical protein FNV43_RR26514 [Rhamnella rubrinervis]